MFNIKIKKLETSKSLKKIQFLVDRIFCEPMSVGSIYGSHELDSLCQKIGQLTLKKIRVGLCQEDNNLIDKNLTIYIVSKLQISGGHTAALFDIVRSSIASRSIIFVTNTCGFTNKKLIFKRFKNISNLQFEYAPRGNHLKKLI